MLNDKPDSVQFYTFDTFLRDMHLPPKITFEEFRKRIGRKNRRPEKDNPNSATWKIRRMTFDSFVDKIREKKPNDPRLSPRESLWETKNQFDEVLDSLYFLFVSDREHTLRFLYNSWLKINPKIGFYASMDLSWNIMDKNGILSDCDPKITKFGRILKNRFVFDHLKLNKINCGGNLNLWETCFQPFIDYQFPGIYFTPAMVNVLNTRNYKSMIGCWRGVGSYASVLNPYLTAWILKHVLHAKKLLTPVLSWGSYSIAGVNVGLEEHVGIDVIKDVCDFSENLYPYFESNVKHQMYCCPSEQMDARHDFSNKYKEHFDTVFFCPPYFNLELYQGGEQSYESFNTLEDWIKGYWEPTVAMCHRTLQKGGTFSYIISDFKDQRMQKVPLCDSMFAISEKYFKHVETKKVQHQNQVKGYTEKMAEGNYERFFIFHKD